MNKIKGVERKKLKNELALYKRHLHNVLYFKDLLEVSGITFDEEEEKVRLNKLINELQNRLNEKEELITKEQITESITSFKKNIEETEANIKLYLDTLYYYKSEGLKFLEEIIKE